MQSFILSEKKEKEKKNKKKTHNNVFVFKA